MSAQQLEPDVYTASFTAEATAEEIGRVLLTVVGVTHRPVLVHIEVKA